MKHVVSGILKLAEEETPTTLSDANRKKLADLLRASQNAAYSFIHFLSHGGESPSADLKKVARSLELTAKWLSDQGMRSAPDMNRIATIMGTISKASTIPKPPVDKIQDLFSEMNLIIDRTYSKVLKHY